MKPLFTLLLPFILLSASSSNALSVVQPTDTDHQMPSLITLAGKGLIDKESKATLALACVEPEPNPCRVVQFFAMIDGEFTWIGRKHVLVTEEEITELDQNNSSPEAQTLQAKRMKAYMKTLRKSAQSSVRQNAWKWIIPGVVWPASVVGGAALFVAGSATIGFLIPLATWYALGKLVAAQSNQDVLGRLSAGNQIAEKITLKDGFNWSAHPKAVSARVFNSYLCSTLFPTSGNENEPVIQKLNALCRRGERVQYQ